MRRFLLPLLLLLPLGALGQTGNTVILRFAGAPAGGCSIVMLAVNNATGELYDCKAGAWSLVGPGGAASGYQTIADEGTSLTQRTVLNFTGAGVSCADNAGATRTDCTVAGGGSTTFDLVGSGTNNSAAMIVTTGASLDYSLNGVINATKIQGVALSGTPAVGQVPIATSATAAAWGDPIVSGATAIGAAPTTNPVFVGTWDGTNIQVPLTVNATPGATDYALVVRNIPSGTQAVSWSGQTVTATQATASSLNATVVGTGTFAVQAAQSGTWNIGTLTSITNAVTVAQATASSLNATVVGTGTFAVQAAQSGTWSVRLQDGSGNTISSTSNALHVNVQNASLAVTNAGTFATQSQPTPVTSGGLSTCYITSAASTNATNCKASAGQVYHISVINTTSTLYYLRMYNAASGPTCSSATGFVESLPTPHASGNGAGFVKDIAVGQAYGTGIGFCLTGGGSSTDNTNAATGVYVTILYK